MARKIIEFCPFHLEAFEKGAAFAWGTTEVSFIKQGKGKNYAITERIVISEDDVNRIVSGERVTIDDIEFGLDKTQFGQPEMLGGSAVAANPGAGFSDDSGEA